MMNKLIIFKDKNFLALKIEFLKLIYTSFIIFEFIFSFKLCCLKNIEF